MGQNKLPVANEFACTPDNLPASVMRAIYLQLDHTRAALYNTSLPKKNNGPLEHRQ